jgi:Sulfotransferase family
MHDWRRLIAVCWQVMNASILQRVSTSFGVQKPNLFIIGAMKSGTTYLAQLLSSHPSIFMCNPKEPSYFVDATELQRLWPYAWQLGYWRSEQRYLRLFQSSGTATILAEASVYYTHLPLASGVAERISQFNPNAQLIYIVRDPVVRTIAHYWHRVRWHGESRPPLHAIINDPRYSDVSNYAMQLAPYLALFDRDQIQVLTLEDLICNADKLLEAILRWLNLDGPPTSVCREPENVTPDIVQQSILPVWLTQRDLYQFVISGLPNSVKRYAQRNLTKAVYRKSVDTSDVEEYLRPRQRAETEELVKLLGRNFPEWTTLYKTDKSVNSLGSMVT